MWAEPTPPPHLSKSQVADNGQVAQDIGVNGGAATFLPPPTLKSLYAV
jgi:hypothetical protein